MFVGLPRTGGLGGTTMTNLILGITTIALLAWLLRSPRHRITAWQRSITDHLPSRRAPVIARARDWASGRLRRLESRFARERANTSVPADQDVLALLAEEASGLHAFSLTIAPIDAAAQGLLCVLTMPQFSLLTNLGLGIVIGTGLWLATYWCFAFWENRSTPARSVRVARRVAFLTFGLAFLGGIVYGAARYATPDLFVGHENIVLASLVALAEFLPIAGGAASFGVRVARRHTDSARRLARLHDEREFLTEFLSWLEEQEASPVATPRLVEHA